MFSSPLSRGGDTNVQTRHPGAAGRSNAHNALRSTRPRILLASASSADSPDARGAEPATARVKFARSAASASPSSRRARPPTGGLYADNASRDRLPSKRSMTLFDERVSKEGAKNPGAATGSRCERDPERQPCPTTSHCRYPLTASSLLPDFSLWWWGFAGVRGHQEGVNRVASILLVGVLHKTCRTAVPARAAGRLRESRSERFLLSLPCGGSLGSR